MNGDLPDGRRDLIAQRLADGQTVVATALAAEFGVSEDAIRRDLRALAADGHCKRVYGGALPLSPANRPMTSRMGESQERKSLLARKAATLVRPGEVVFLDNGSTNLALVAELPDNQNLTIFTNSVAIASAALMRPGLRLVLIGGAVNSAIGGCVDAEAVLALQRIEIDRCFVGACSVSARGGVSAFDHADATFKRQLLAATRDAVTLATTDKLDTRAPYRVTPLSGIATLVLEHDAPPGLRDGLAAAGPAILIADAPA